MVGIMLGVELMLVNGGGDGGVGGLRCWRWLI